MAEQGNFHHSDEGDEEEEEEEEIDQTGYKAVKDAVLFAIDVSSSMLRPQSNSESKKADRDTATSAALKCAYALMQQRIISNPNDMMGILLFGTEQSKFQEDEESSGGSYQYPNCYLLSDLDIPAAADVKRLRSLVEDETVAAKLLVPSGEPVAMANVLFCANQIFTTKAPNFSSRRLFLVTDNDNPHAKNKELKSSAIVRAKDLYDLGVIIELFPISQPDHEFDRSRFYDDIVYRSHPEDPEAPAPIAVATKPSASRDGISLLTSLLTSINSKIVPKRALFSNIPLEFSQTFKITVKGYIIFKRQLPARSCYVWLDGETPQIALGTTTHLADDTARTVEKAEVRKAFKFGGETVTFTPEELLSLKTFGEPVIRILGFKPQSLLPMWAKLRPSTFIYPSEEEYVGSTRTFSALQQTLLAKNKMAIVLYIARKTATPVLAALLPGAEKLGEHGEQVMPPGMWIVQLPYADDIRANPELAKKIHAQDALIDAMRKVVQQLQLPRALYDPAKYPNPALQWHYRILQALALDEDVPEHPKDETVPRYRQIHKRVGEYALAWGEELAEQYRLWQHKQDEKRIKQDEKRIKQDDKRIKHINELSRDTESEMASKKIKREHGSASASSTVAAINDDEMKGMIKRDTVHKLTKPVLQDFLRSKGVSQSGLTKIKLVEAIERYFESKMDVSR